MNPFNFLFATGVKTTEFSLGEIFPLNLIPQNDFVRQDILATLKRILRDTVARTDGLSDEQKNAMNDSCVQNEAPKGLITLLAEAMAEQQEVFIVYKKGVVRLATNEERAQILADYKKSASSSVGIYVSFKNYDAAQRLKLYSALEYLATCSIYAKSNLSKAVQVKISNLRSSVSLADAEVAKAQASEIARALKAGQATLLDSADAIEVPTVDTAATEKALDFINGKRAEILGMPVVWLEGETTNGMNASGESDERAVERGLMFYFDWIIKPVCKALFGVVVNFKTRDFRIVESALNALRTFDLTSDSLLSKEAKLDIVARMFDLNKEELKKQVEETDTSNASGSLSAKGAGLTEKVVPGVGA